MWITEGLLSYFQMSEVDKLMKLISSDDRIWNEKQGNRNWIIGTMLNAKTKLQQELNEIWKENKMNEMKFEGYSKPHLFLKQYGYQQYDIQPTGGRCNQYEEYLKELDNIDENTVSDTLAKSFLFLGMK